MFRIPSSHLLSIAFGVVVFSTLSQTAEAGFFVSEAEIFSKSPLPKAIEPSDSSQKPDPSIPIPRRVQETWADDAPISGMSSPSTSSTLIQGGGAIAVLSTNLIDSSTQLITQLGPEGRVWLPPPFSTGVFRPPRYC